MAGSTAGRVPRPLSHDSDQAIIQLAEPDYARYDIDLAIVYFPEKMLQPDDIVLLREEVFPVCSPDLYPLASKAVCRCRLLQEAHKGSPEIDWRSWALEFDLPDDFETKIVRYTSFSQVIGAAAEGCLLGSARRSQRADVR